ncbi:hypothetical protein ACE6H2_016597 [Prunus campanulata]
MYANVTTNIHDRWRPQIYATPEASSSNRRPILRANEIQNWLRLGSTCYEPNPEVFVGPRSWILLGLVSGPIVTQPFEQNSLGFASFVNSTRQLEVIDEVSPHVNCLSVVALENILFLYNSGLGFMER